MHYIIYKTTNIINDMFYIGCHQTSTLNDGYIGSGKHLKRAIKKYGFENFKFEILFYCSSKNEMFDKEREIVNEEFVKNPLTYNLKIGGSGGNPSIVGAFTGKTHSEETKEKQRHFALNRVTTEQTKQKLSENNWAKTNPSAFKEHMRNINVGKPKSIEHKLRLSENQKGKKLVNNGTIAKWATTTEIESLLQQGWMIGKIKK